MIETFKIGNQNKNIGVNIAAFDFDHTIVKPKKGQTFPENVDDWHWINNNVPNIITNFSKTHDIIIITDQTKLWKLDMIKNVLNILNIDVLVIIGNKDTKKPNPELFNKYISNFNKDISFYCGDAAGRNSDWSDSDKKFAENINITFKLPEEVFINKIEFENHSDKNYCKKEQEIIILVGYPCSGKSTFVKNNFKNINSNIENKYERVDGDILKTIPKMLKQSEIFINNKKSIIIDRTNPKKEDRLKFIELAKKYNILVRCFVFNTTIEQAIELNNLRMNETGKKVPKIALYVFRKKYEEPTIDECDIIKINIIKV